MGTHFTKWYGMLPPDRMHLWWEGMAKHVIEWFFALIDLNNANGDAPWSTTVLDEMLMSFDTQHSDKVIWCVKLALRSCLAHQMAPLAYAL